MAQLVYALPLVLTDEKRGDRPVYKLLEDVTVQGLLCLAGFLTDLVSAPGWARKWLPIEKMARAALAHDWAYNMTSMSRWKADLLLCRQMKQDGVAFYWRWAVWLYLKRPFAPRVKWSQPYLHVSILDTLPESQ